jgi:hypothetical protein
MRSKESYMHFYAKKIIEEWLISAWKYNKKMQYNNKLYIFDWQIDCSDDNYGIRLEYPILSKTQKENKIILGAPSAWVRYPDIDKLADNVKVEAVIDLVIIEHGKVKYGIEVVHKHICSKTKRIFLKTYLPGLKVYEISAEWVLNQLVSAVPPKKWPCIAITAK